MAVFSKEHKELTRKLIETVSGFEPREENFKLCFQFAKANFRFHRFLDVNDLHVSRAISGIKEKFEVHSQPEKAGALDELTSKFLSLHLENSYPRSDAHYGLLLFLLSVADSPVNSDYVGGPETPSQQEPIDDFDWTRHLMEGIHYQTYDSDSGSEWSDSASEIDEATPTKHDLNDSAMGEELLEEGESPPVSHSHSVLLERVQVPYWDILSPQHHVDVCSLPDQCLAAASHPACSLANQWSSYVKSMEPLYPPLGQMITLTEAQLVRETLWACLGAESSFVYEFGGSKVTTRKDIQVLHLTPLSLQHQLAHFSGFISMLHLLRNTCRGLTFDPVPCKTYEAFTSALRECLSELEDRIREVERTVVSNAALVTLLSLEVSLSEVYSRVQELYAVVSCVLEQLPSPPTPFALCSILLSTLWTSLSRVDALGYTGHTSCSTLLPLWLATVRPYFDFVERWIEEGGLDVKWEEFCIQREECGERDWTWMSGFSLREPVPEFLQPVIHQVLQAGKSMHVIEEMGKRKEMDRVTSSTSLYNAFLATLKSSTSQSLMSHDPSLMSRDQHTGSHNQATPTWRLDPLAQKYICFLPTNVSSEPAQSPNEELWQMLSSIHIDSTSLPLTLQHTLSALLTARCHKSSGSLVRLLTDQYQLTTHFKTVQRFFLMGDGPVMHHFTSDIFQQIQDGGTWEDASYLNAVLHEALQGQLADSTDLEQRLKVVYTPPTGHTHQSSLSCVSLQYTVPWPLAMVFPEALMTTYNKVFQLLLNVNWAKWSLETVHLKQVQVTRLSPPLQRQARLLLLLRTRLLHFVNNLTNYLMTRILHSVGVEFQRSVEGAVDVDSILQLHVQYTETLFDRCLLNTKASIVKEAITNVLNQVVRFKQHWDRGVANFSSENARRIEDEFSKCSHFLISCLNNTVKRGAFPHLETLAFSMRTLKTGQKIFT